MTTRFLAVVDHGVLKPTTDVGLDEGSTVEVFVVPQRGDLPVDAAAELAELAKLASTAGDPNTSRDHDEAIYGRKR